MIKLYKPFIVILAIITLISCKKDKEVTEEKGRPHSPWVFRSVMNDMPRAITFALDDNLWVSYSAKNASLYKAWKGSVDFEGSVFNSAHGPQPKIVGDAYIHNKHIQPWVVKSGGQIIEPKVQYKGHRIGQEHAELMYEISYNGNTIQVTEQPEAVNSKSGGIAFDRTFTVTGLRSGDEVGLKTNVSSIISKNNIQTNGKLEVVQEKEITKGKITALELDAILWMNAAEPTSFTTQLVAGPLLVNPFKKDIEAVASANEGLGLVAKSDCRTCHNVNSKTVGPAYMTISKRYAMTDDNISYLASKIKAGGSGVWGIPAMTPHPDIPESDLKKMAAYVIGLVPDSEKEVSIQDSEGGDELNFEAMDVKEKDMLWGALTKVYQFNRSINKLPDFSKLGKPSMAGLMLNFDNIGDGKFTDLDENFALTAEGYLKIEKDMDATFRMWSDDGTKLFIDDQLIIDHDGNHGISSKEKEVGLKAGYHAFKIEYYNGSSGKFLSFNWKPEGGEFEIVPSSMIFHDITRAGETRDLDLPMAVSSMIPGDRIALEEMHPSFDLSSARPNNFTPKVGGMDFLPDGRLAVSTWDAEGGVYLLDNVTGGVIKPKRIASGLAEPLGLKVVDGQIYIMQKQELTRLVDTNGDDIIDEYQTVTDGWKVSTNFHEFGFGLEYMDGYFYATLATAILPGGASMQPQIQDRGKVVKINKETGEIEFMAHGLRTPNGIGVGIDGELFVADNQGDWLPSSKIVHVSNGAFYGGRSVDFEGTKDLKVKQPLVWLPQNEIGNSPSTPLYINVGPYSGQMIHGEVTHGGVKRVFVEKVDGEYQGAVFRFMQGLEAGVNRLVWGPDGSLFMGGIGNPGNWQHTGTNWYGLQRMKYNEKSTFEMLAVRAKSNGIEIEFTEPLKEDEGWNKSSYEIKQWYYKPTVEYGGPKLDERTLNIKSVNVSADRKKVFLELAGMKAGHVVYVHLAEMFVSELGHELWTTEAWYTMNSIPNTAGQKMRAPVFSQVDNTLSSAEKAAGWELLFDGKTTDKFRKYKEKTLGTSWKVANGEIYLDSKKMDDGRYKAEDGGDLMTKEEYENFEFMIDWKISDCGNSGIIYNIHEDDEFDATFKTGPEMQILDNTCHPDAKLPTHRAGALYDLIETKYVTVKPAGEWNRVRIRIKDGALQQWQNGRIVVETTLYDANWARMISESKFKNWKGFGTYKKGHIAMQDHGDRVWFKNIKIRKL